MRLAETPFLIAAGVVHLALPVAAHVAPTPQYAQALLANTDFGMREIEVDIAEQPFLDPPKDNAPQNFVPHPPEQTPSIAHREIDRPISRRSAAARPTAAEKTAPPTVLTADEGSPQEPVDEYSQPPAPSEYTTVPIGPGGPRIWAIPEGMPVDPSRSAAPTKPGARRKVAGDVGAKAVERAVREKDKKLGLHFPAAGGIAAAVAGAVRASSTPYECKGVVAVAVSGKGKVTTVRVGSYTGGSGSAWQQVAAATKGALAGRTFSMRSDYAKGAIVTVVVISQKRMPAGSGGRKGLGLEFDPSNIGAKAIRVVTTAFNVTAVK